MDRPLAADGAGAGRRRTPPYALTPVTNARPATLRVEERQVHVLRTAVQRRMLAAEWPCHVFSLSHVALPFPSDVPLYGDSAPRTERHVRRGRSEARGEIGVLNVPAWWLLGQRSNPFHAYLVERVNDALDVPPRAGAVATGAVAP